MPHVSPTPASSRSRIGRDRRAFRALGAGLLAAALAALPAFAQDAPPTPEDQARRLLRQLAERPADPSAGSGPALDFQWDRVTELAALGREARRPITEALASEHALVRLAAAGALCAMEEATPETFDALLALAAGAAEPEAMAALDLLERCGSDGEPELYVEALKAQLARDPQPAREIALWRAIWHLDLQAEPASLTRLAALAEHASARVRQRAALALVQWDAARFAQYRALLEDAALEPDGFGRTVRAVVENLRLRQALAAPPPPKEDPRVFAPPDCDFLEELVYLARRYYVDEGAVRDTREIQESGVDYATIDLIARGFARALDPFSSWHSEETQQRLNEDIAGAYGGIGAYVTETAEWNDGKYVAITAPNYAGPAYEAGLRSRDEILGADGELFEPLTPFGGYTGYGGRLLRPDGRPYADDEAGADGGKGLQFVIKRLKGRPATMVDILIRRRGWDEPRIVTVRRGLIQVPTVEAEMLPGGLGYARLTQFGAQTDREFDATLAELARRGMKGLILDLRDNPGGQLPTVLGVNAALLPKGARISSAVGRIAGWNRPIPGPQGNLWNNERDGIKVPIVCLINGNSASGSEMTSAALRGNDRALIIGENTFGKGSGQRTYNVPGSKDTRILKITIFEFFTPKEQTIHVVGVAPHIELKAQELSDNEAWTSFLVEERLRLLALRADDDYLDRHYAANKDLLAELAAHDGGTAARYPGFDEWYDSLGTRFTRDMARRFLRNFGLRRVVADDRGVKYVQSYLDDNVLQRGIVELLKKTQQDAAAVKEYQPFLRAE